MKLSTFIFLIHCIFKVQGQSLPLPYYSGFDDALEKAGWQEFRLGIQSMNKWTYSTSDYCSPSTSIFHGYNVGGSATDTVEDWFVSPPLNISSPAKLNFKISPTFYGTKLSVMVGTGSNDPSVGNFTQIAYYNLPYTTWNECLDTSANIITLADTTYLAFKYIGTNYNTFYIDNISVIPDSTTAIENIEPVKYQFSVAPNPFTSQITINSNSNICAIEIHNIFGQTIYSQKILNPESLILNLDFPNGFYFLTANISGQIQTMKIIKM